MTTDIPFSRDFDPAYGQSVQVSPLIRRVVAHNPSPFTFTGTGTYIVGHGTVAVIDPGPDLPDHLDALLRALKGETVSHILVTHTHLDHSPLARPLAQATGAPILAFGPHGSKSGDEDDPVEEGGDHTFRPDQRLKDGDVIRGPGWTLQAVHTPGHTANHLCFALAEEKALFPGDHVMGWSTTVVSPPDGDMAAYMASLKKLMDRDDEIYWPTHGGPIHRPRRFLSALLAHRRSREEQILAAVAQGLDTIPAMVAKMYAAVDKRLHPAAARSVLAHIIHLCATGRLATDGPPGPDSRYRLP
jgi:glyoxylase-like metal-dependent hydrolase (beta-lactamase superfamily II)